MATDQAQDRQSAPALTWTLALLIVVVYLWDRRWNPVGPPTTFVDLALRPTEAILLFRGQGDPLVLLKFFTSLFLHSGLVHMAGNLVFLMVFGPQVEGVLGARVYAVFFLVSGFVAALSHIFVNAGSFAGLLGASGAIGGLLGANFVLFPASRIRLWLVFETVSVPAWALLGSWFVAQLLIPQQGVANWAHVGGFVAGMVGVLFMGGREKVLKEQAHEA